MEKVSRSIIFNGKFLAGPATGVQRVAAEMIKAVDTILLNTSLSSDALDVHLLMPSQPKRQIPLRKIQASQIGILNGIPWEQLDLPRLAKGRLILSLANLGPVLASNSITMIHDAQTFTHPDSYSRGFTAWYRLIQPILGRRSKRILTVSEFSKRQLVNYGVAAEEKIDVIYNGVDHINRIQADENAVANLKLRPRKFVLSLANSQPHKNIVVLLKAFANPKLKEVDLILFGSASTAILEQINGSTLSLNVKTVGHISDTTLKGLMESALCLAFPSKTEGFGLPPLEAMIVGCPTIVSPCGALPEVCGSAALYANQDDPGNWVDHILALAEDAQFWTSQSQACVAYASRFTWQKSATQLLTIAQNYL